MGNNKLPKISVIVPVFNEEETIEYLHNRLTNSIKQITDLYEIIYINDGSQDNTLQKVKSLSENDERVKYISFTRNFGHQVALSAGLDHATGDTVTIIDGDLQDPPELIPALYRKYQEGFEVVYAKRTSRKGETMFKILTAKIFLQALKGNIPR